LNEASSADTTCVFLLLGITHDIFFRLAVMKSKTLFWDVKGVLLWWNKKGLPSAGAVSNTNCTRLD
jgi:hypothetical protein